MRLKKSFGCAAWVVAVAIANVAHADLAIANEAAESASGGSPIQPADIVVTARRAEEKLQDVPVAVSVVSQTTIDSHGVFNPVDLATTAPGLEVTATIADRNNITFNIRGEGQTFGSLFPAVITYFNEVPIAHVTQGQFFDLANVQVLRGPQGVQFGRVTDGGNVMLEAQAPKNSFGGYLDAKLGNYSMRTVSGAINIPIIADKVLFRASFETDRRAGFTINDFNGKDLDNVHSDAYRGVLTIHPIDSFKNVTTVAYQHTDDNGTSVIFDGFNTHAITIAGGLANPHIAPILGAYGIDTNGDVVYKYTGAPFTSPLIPGAAGLTAMNIPNYIASLSSQLAAQTARGVRHVNLTAPLFDKRTNLYITNVSTLDITSDIQAKNVFGYVREKDVEAQLYIPENGGLVNPCHSGCSFAPAQLPYNNSKQWSDEIRLAGKSLDRRLVWSVGAYFDQQSPVGLQENFTSSLGVLQRDGVNYTTSTSRAFYGSAEYAITDAWKVNAGIRNTHDTVHSVQQTITVPTFLRVPAGLCQTYLTFTCNTFDSAFTFTSWTAGTSYKVANDKLLYAKISTGYRPGGVNGTAPPGTSPAYGDENDTSIEIGVKADWHIGDMFARTNIAAFHDRYKGIQKALSSVIAGTLYSYNANIAAATIQGVEFEGMLVPVKGLKLGATAAYTSAKYDHVDTSGYTTDLGSPLGVVSSDPCNPNLFANSGFCTDNRIAATPEFQWTLSADYSTDLGDKIGQASLGVNMYHQSSIALTDVSMLNPAAVQRQYSIVNLNAALKNAFGQPLDLGFFVTNLTNKTYRIGADANMQRSSIGAEGSIYAAPRMFGFSMKYRFGSDAK